MPADFAWGVSSSAFQTEGATTEDGRGSSIWDDLCKIPGRIGGRGNADTADDFYHKYLQDIQIMKSLGITHFRFSLSWSRILPDGTSPNQKGIDFYSNVLDALLAADIQPYVTLYHWDLPSKLNDKSDKGGWLSEDIIPKFDAYADLCFDKFGDRVKTWITFNDPK